MSTVRYSMVTEMSWVVLFLALSSSANGPSVWNWSRFRTPWLPPPVLFVKATVPMDFSALNTSTVTLDWSEVSVSFCFVSLVRRLM
ncbi:hypothetical protein D3C76_1358660 [compost metagenome]